MRFVVSLESDTISVAQSIQCLTGCRTADKIEIHSFAATWSWQGHMRLDSLLVAKSFLSLWWEIGLDG